MKRNERAVFHFQELMKVYFTTGLIFMADLFLLLAIRKEPVILLKASCMLLMPLYYYVLRRTVRNFFLFLFTHLLGFAAALVFVFPTFEPVLFGVFMIGALGYFISSFIFRNVEDVSALTMSTAIMQVVLLTIFYLLAGIKELEISELYRPHCLGYALVMMLIFFVETHLENVNRTLHNVNEMIANPVDKIRRYNNRILLFFILVLAAVVSAVLLLHGENLITGFFAGLWSLLKFLISLIPKKERSTDFSEAEGNPFFDKYGNSIGMTPGKPSQFWIFLEYLARAFFYACVVFLIGYAVYRFYKWFYSRKAPEISFDEFEEVSDYVETPLKKSGNSFRETLVNRLMPDNRKRIRRIYRRKLEDDMKNGVLRVSDTPGEILEKKPSPQMEILTRLYEKARYTQEEITKEDVREAQQSR